MFVFHVFAALAEFVRAIIVASTNDGLAAPRAHGQRLGRPPVMTTEEVAYALQLLAEPERSLRFIVALLKMDLPQSRARTTPGAGPPPHNPEAEEEF
jgi:DNA invertase Pin-like site-specific DNA recombinase